MIIKFLLNNGKIKDIYRNIEKYKPYKESKVSIVFDGVIADMLSNKKLQPIITGIFSRSRNINISLVFITQSSFVVSKNIIINSTYYFIMKIPNKRELQQIAINDSLDIDFKDFMMIFK